MAKMKKGQNQYLVMRDKIKVLEAIIEARNIENERLERELDVHRQWMLLMQMLLGRR